MMAVKKKRALSQGTISVIIPVYNSLSKMERLIKSIEEQDYEKFEVIFVDDESCDNSYEYLKEYFKSDRRIKVYRKKHEGPGPARRFGFQKSQGDILVFIDSDDWFYSSHSFLKVNELLAREDIDICLAFRELYPSKEPLGPFSDKTVERSLKFGIHGIDIFSNRQIRGSMSAKIFRRRIMREDMFMGAYNFEDMFTTLAYLDHCSKVLYTSEFVQIHNQEKGNDSLTKTKDYAVRTLPERAEGIIKISRIIKSKPILATLSNLALGVYCDYLSRRMIFGENRKVIRRLEKVIRGADLSGFYPSYSFKKKAVLWFLRIKGFAKHEN